MLCLSACAVDAGGSFGRVTTHEPEVHCALAHPNAFIGEHDTPLLVQ